jgi:hypothetical protein
MQRNIPANILSQILKQETDELFLLFVRLRHSALTEDIRVVTDSENYILDGFEYQGFQFSIKILSDSEGVPSAQIEVQNVDRRQGEAVLRAVDPVRAELQIIAGSEFDMTEFPRIALNDPVNRIYRARGLYLTNVECTLSRMTGTLRSWDYTQETWPAVRAVQEKFPGLFW